MRMPNLILHFSCMRDVYIHRDLAGGHDMCIKFKIFAFNSFIHIQVHLEPHAVLLCEMNDGHEA